MKKRIFSGLLALILCIASLPLNVFAAEPQANGHFEVAIMSEHGETITYTIHDNEIMEVPIFAYATDENGNSTRDVTNVATLQLWTETNFDEYQLHFNFEPTTTAIALLTIGFSGTLESFHRTGTKWGANVFKAQRFGHCSAASGGFGVLSGTYTVVGYSTATILETYST